MTDYRTFGEGYRTFGKGYRTFGEGYRTFGKNYRVFGLDKMREPTKQEQEAVNRWIKERAVKTGLKFYNWKG